MRGLSEEDARRRLVPSLTTVIGLVKHAAAVERNWFFHWLARLPREQIAGNSTGDDASWEVDPGETIAEVVAEYEDVCRQSRRLAADFELAHPDKRRGKPQGRRAPVRRSPVLRCRAVSARSQRNSRRRPMRSIQPQRP